jgi:hypothetical protein
MSNMAFHLILARSLGWLAIWRLAKALVNRASASEGGGERPLWTIYTVAVFIQD